MRAFKPVALAFLAWLNASTAANPLALAARQDATNALSSCPGYKASNVKTSSHGLTADLTLAGKPCNAYGTDLSHLTLTVEYQTDSRLHVKIQDAANQVYQVPDSVFPRPSAGKKSAKHPALKFKYHSNPFSFSVIREDSGDVLFDTAAASLVFESQYVRLRTNLPQNPSLYGLGEHTDPFQLNTTNYTRTLWNRDAYTVPPGTNLYGDHPIYFDHRGSSGTHGVFLLNSNGMDIFIDDTGSQFLEYNLLGGVLDFYFVAGPSPVEVAQQYSEIVGKSAMMPYWGFGFHQCRYGMQDVYEVAEVVANYSAANIPLETMWTDIDYMYLRQVFTLDPYRFPLKLMRELVSTLHSRQQHYIMMVDPAVAAQNYPPYNDGVSSDSFLKNADGSVYHGVVWPGVTAFPDWFSPSTQAYWDEQFRDFFNPTSGVDIDALWIDMNEASNFCDYPCTNPEAEALSMGDPPRPPPIRLGSPRPISGFPADFQPQCHSETTFNVNANTFYGENIVLTGSAFTLGGYDMSNSVPMSADSYPIWSVTVDMPANTTFTYQYARVEPDGSYIYEAKNLTGQTGACGSTQATHDTITTQSPPQSSKSRRSLTSVPHQVRGTQGDGDATGLAGRDLINPAYQIHNAAGSLSNKTLNTNLIHSNGYAEYDTHNLFGAMMSETSRMAMLSRRPTVRPLVITRSTFAGSGRQVGHWLGDNVADWTHYLISVSGLLQFGSLYQLPMVGSDVCGYAGTTNVNLCARWAMLGAFSTFYRNHEASLEPPHEFYRWPLVAEAARNAITIRYQLLDYIYTAFYEQNQTGTPCVQPMFFVYPNDKQTNALQYQYFYGPSLMVAPVTEDNSTSTTIYMPNDIFYDYYTHDMVQGSGSEVTLTDVPYTSIPLYFKGGSIIPMRANSANTTTELRKENFNLIIAPDQHGKAKGSLYLDEGNNLDQPHTSYIHFNYNKGAFTMSGKFDYNPGVHITRIEVLGGGKSNHYQSTGPNAASTHTIPLTQAYSTML